MSKTMKNQNNLSVVPLSTIERVKRHVNPDKVDYVSDSQVERQYLRTISKERSNKWPNTLDVSQDILLLFVLSSYIA